MTDTQPSTQHSNLPDASLLSWRFTLARRMFQVISIISLPAFLASAYYAFDEGTYVYVPIYIGMLVFMLVIGFWKRVSDTVRVFGLMALIYFIVLLDFYTEGRGSLARSFLIIFSFLGAIFFGRRGAIIAAVFGLLTMILFAYLYTTNVLPDYQVSSTIVSGWISNTVIVAVLMTLIIFSVDYLVREMTAFLTRSQQLNQMVEADRVNLEQRVQERTAAAEAARAEAVLARQEAESQAWSTRGHAQLSEQMRGDLDLPTLANNITSHLSRYIGAQTGALFVASGDVLKLTGRYAYVERAGHKSEFRLGESLIGEAAKSKRIILVDDIPADAPLVSSALGESTPRQIIIAPLESNGQVLGVIELATLTQFTSEHQAFLNRVSESAAIALRTVQTRLRMSELLAQSQQQAEELQSQEEELRAANEELQARTESLSAIVKSKKWDTA